MRKSQKNLIIGVAIGIGVAAVASAVYVHHVVKKLHLFDATKEQDQEKLESILPKPAGKYHKQYASYHCCPGREEKATEDQASGSQPSRIDASIVENE